MAVPAMLRHGQDAHDTGADLKGGATWEQRAMAVPAMLRHGQDAHGTGADLKGGATRDKAQEFLASTTDQNNVQQANRRYTERTKWPIIISGNQLFILV